MTQVKQVVLTPETKLKIKDSFVLREIGGEAVIIPTDDSSLIGNGMMSPNETATFIYKCFLEPSTIPEVLNKCVEQYDGDPQQMEAAIVGFVQQSLQIQMIEEVK